MKLLTRTLHLVPVAALLAIGACNRHRGNSTVSREKSANASTYDASLARGWMDHAYLWVKEDGTNPPEASRKFAYLGVTLWESAAPGVAGGKSLEGVATGLTGVPEAQDDEVYSWPLVANAAVAMVSRSLFLNSGPEIDVLEAEGLLANPADADVMSRSHEFGVAISVAIMAWADADGFADSAARDSAFTPPSGAGAWIGTGTGLHPGWGGQRTFLLSDSSEFDAAGHPGYSIDPSSAFYASALDVYNTTGDSGASLTADQLTIARYWADGPAATGTPGGHMIAMTGMVLRMATYDHLDVAAEAYARVGMALADAFIVCWRVKYDTYLLRPITYIHDHIDPAWDPVITTPNFPTYVSGHSLQSSAAATVLTAVFGPIGFTDSTHADFNPELGFTDRSYINFHEAANEAKDSRLYGGIHFRFDNQDGYNLGVDIAGAHNMRLEGVFGD